MTAVTQRAEARVFAQLSKDLAAQADVHTTCERIVDLARTVTGCDLATLWTLNQQASLQLRSSTDLPLAEVHAEVIGAVQEGPELECLLSRSVIKYEDLEADPRWGAYRDMLLRSAEPMLSGLVLPVGTEGGAVGVLALSSKTADFFDQDLEELALTLADQFSLVLEVAMQRSKAENLELALNSNRRIGIAIGIIMNGRRMTDEQAFAVLRASSQEVHMKLRDVAEEVIFTGASPVARARQVLNGG
jgi:GAF domain-containing protein